MTESHRSASCEGNKDKVLPRQISVDIPRVLSGDTCKSCASPVGTLARPTCPQCGHLPVPASSVWTSRASSVGTLPCPACPQCAHLRVPRAPCVPSVDTCVSRVSPMGTFARPMRPQCGHLRVPCVLSGDTCAPRTLETMHNDKLSISKFPRTACVSNMAC